MTVAERAQISRPIEALRSIAEAIGLDPDRQRITAIDVHASVKDVPKVAVTMLMDVEGSGKLCEVVKRYRLVDDQADGVREATAPSGVGMAKIAAEYLGKLAAMPHEDFKRLVLGDWSPPRVEQDGLRGRFESISHLRDAMVTARVRLYCDASRGDMWQTPPCGFSNPIAVDPEVVDCHLKAGLISEAARDHLYEIRNHQAIDALDGIRDTIGIDHGLSTLEPGQLAAVSHHLTSIVGTMDRRLYFAFDEEVKPAAFVAADLPDAEAQTNAMVSKAVDKMVADAFAWANDYIDAAPVAAPADPAPPDPDPKSWRDLPPMF